MRQSLRILRQAIAMIPGGELYTRLESGKGEIGVFIQGNDDVTPWRFKILGSIDVIMGSVDRRGRSRAAAKAICRPVFRWSASCMDRGNFHQKRQTSWNGVLSAQKSWLTRHSPKSVPGWANL